MSSILKNIQRNIKLLSCRMKEIEDCCEDTGSSSIFQNGLTKNLLDEVGLGGTLVKDTAINIDTFNLTTQGTGNITLDTTAYTDMEMGIRATDDLIQDPLLPPGATLKGVGLTYRRPSNGIIGRIFTGDVSALGGGTDQVGFGVGDFAGTTPSVDVTGLIDTASGDAYIQLQADSVGAGTAAMTFDINGNQVLSLYNGTVSILSSYTLPTSDGTNGQVLTTNGSGYTYWASLGGGGSTLYNSDDVISDPIRNVDVNSNILQFQNADIINLETNNNGSFSLSSAGTTILSSATGESMLLETDAGFQLSVNGLGADLNIDCFDGNLNLIAGNNGNLRISDGQVGNGNGSAGQVLTSDGNNAYWSNSSGGGIYSGSGILGADPVIVSGAAMTAGIEFVELNKFDVQSDIDINLDANNNLALNAFNAISIGSVMSGIDINAGAFMSMHGGTGMAFTTGYGTIDINGTDGVDIIAGNNDISLTSATGGVNVQSSSGQVTISSSTGTLMSGIPAYADDTAAGVGGVVINQLYQTDGTGAAPLNVAGILMIKQ